MSFSSYKPNIENGDVAILYFSPLNITQLKIRHGQTLQTSYGAVKHADLIGVKYGSKVNCPKGFFHILHPTSELWTQAVPHRTQILYSTDISMITFQLELTAGSVVIEAGTGSGSLSHALIRSVLPTGHLYTFEFHKERYEKAAKEFEDHGLTENVTITHRDVLNDGFQLEHVADAVFLDLPSPWSCIDSAKQALKLKGGRICSFSPCIEQVSQTCATLAEKGFQDIKTLECLLRKFHVKHTGMPKACLGELTEVEKAHQAKVEARKSQATSQESYEYVTAGPVHDMQGHTGFLTFASLYSH
ncbi:hypothetical protein LOTGIDRAFT_215674 [Lottia gigantea]|uniref:tRNA (adenine(58)-N(1))-methyltransferase catalytic subunit TRMT61A n=1 Tax=Lottia gigantea TaxID=225164 RepID=V4AG97_LOTGI|nr:hypothetical protein LOTGIDRAFT_215674 [Lottia gigantea]ESO94190.1 hypothetical protein LOTGIDRAFT_215674 [Lottia gigantea]